MSTFARDIQVVCLGTLTLLIIYTLWLSRYRGLNGHLAVRWLLIQGGALLTIMFWRWLPLFSVTSSLQDRELLLMVTVLLFAFVIFLILDLLVRNSRQSAQIKRLTQELAIQRERIDTLVGPPAPEAMQDIPEPELPQRGADGMPRGAVLACLWILVCVGFFVVEIMGYKSPSYPSVLKAFLTADYLQ
jgi:hypothetical protein